MGIKSITTDFTGQIGVEPRIVRIKTTDSFATITTAGYLNTVESMGYTFYPNDIFAIAYGTDAATSQLFTQTISNGISTLEPSSLDVALPVVAGNIAVFTNTLGSLGDNATTATNGGNIHAGLSGTAGSLVSYPATAATGAFKIAAVSNAGDTNVTISNSSHAQATIYSISDVGQSTGSLMNCTVSADPGANLIAFDTTVAYTALAGGASVTLFSSSGTKRYKVRALYLNYSAAGFTGGGGNRGGVITDNTQQYATIPAATMQTPINANWGSTALAMDATMALGNTTAAGASLVFKYLGGTTDYTLGGTIFISGIMQRVA